MSARLGPLDEVGDDHEIAGEAHARDDAEFVFQPLLVNTRRLGVGLHEGEVPVEPFGRHLAHGLLLGRTLADLRADRQQRLAGLRHHRAAAGDGERVVAGLGHVGEQRAHGGGGLEPVFRRHPAAIGLGKHAALGDAEQRVMSFVHRFGREVAVIGGDQGQAELIGQRHEAGFDGALDREAVAMQLDRQAIRKHLGEAGEERCRLGALALGEQPVDGAERAAGEQEQPLGVLGQAVEGDLRAQPRIALQVGDGGEPLEVGVAQIGLGEEHERFGCQARLVAPAEGDLAAEDGLHPFCDRGLAELERTEQVAGVCQRHGGHAVRRRQGRELVGLNGTLTERVGRVSVQVDKGGSGHGVRHGAGYRLDERVEQSGRDRQKTSRLSYG